MNAQRIKELDRIEKELSDKLVPATGKAETIGGEMLRAIERMIYRYFNDGDMIGWGYGIETCQSSFFYLEDMLVGFGIIRIEESRFGHIQWSKPECDPNAAALKESKFDYSDNDKYQDALYNLLALVVDFINTDERAKLPNDCDSREYRNDDVEKIYEEFLDNIWYNEYQEEEEDE